MTMTMNLEFHNAKECKPEKSGNYLTLTSRGNEWMYLEWSAKHQAWNAWDSEEAPRNAMEVDYWSEIIHPYYFRKSVEAK